ncbi:hypothetical protein [Rhizobium leguminosarum]|nr:hypothetical protein [Rhizobium leguminosarum]MBY5329909.1 hypothetical protein [Rhizobium leguminosarum]MBY5475052.1 hypothetical protein [Rhizobium leguminosarum]
MVLRDTTMASVVGKLALGVGAHNRAYEQISPDTGAGAGIDRNGFDH